MTSHQMEQILISILVLKKLEDALMREIEAEKQAYAETTALLTKIKATL